MGDLKVGFKKSCAFQPRVIKQNRGSAGEGIWLCWLQNKPYCKNYGDSSLEDGDMLKLMEMNDNHVEYHTVKGFLTFCEHGPNHPDAGNWKSTFPGKYLEGGKEAGGQLVDQRLLPRIVEGEVRMQMVKDTLFSIIHKKPTAGNMSAVGGIADYTFYTPDAPEFASLRAKFEADMPKIMSSMGLENEPLPLLWTADFIPVMATWLPTSLASSTARAWASPSLVLRAARISSSRTCLSVSSWRAPPLSISSARRPSRLSMSVRLVARASP